MKKILPALLLVFAVLSIVSCKKHAADPPGTHLLGFHGDRVIKINQLTTIYDSTVIRDSMDYFFPPTSRLYEWKITPATDVTVGGINYKYGVANLTFTRSGNYQVMANIYDSATHNFLASTNTVEVMVGKDTLFPSYPIYADDVLLLSPRFSIGSTNGGPFLADLLVIGSTTRTYDYSEPYMAFEYTRSISNNSYSFVFSDSLRLTSYPIVLGYNNMSQLQEGLYFPGFTSGMTITLNVTWLNKVYSGTITMNGQEHTINWDNSGAVKFTD